MALPATEFLSITPTSRHEESAYPQQQLMIYFPQRISLHAHTLHPHIINIDKTRILHHTFPAS